MTCGSPRHNWHHRPCTRCGGCADRSARTGMCLACWRAVHAPGTRTCPRCGGHKLHRSPRCWQCYRADVAAAMADCGTCDDAVWLLEAGTPLATAAARLGMRPDSLRRHLQRHNTQRKDTP